MSFIRELRSRHATMDNEEATGAQGFLSDVMWLLGRAQEREAASTWVVLQAAECFAYIQLGNAWRPWRFLADMASVPPIQYGTDGFQDQIVDDANPARHYMAFVFMGYFLPRVAAQALLWAWEILGFIRYGGHWSWPDVRSGNVGIRHGDLLRRYSVVIWPALIARDLVEEQFPRKRSDTTREIG